MIIEKGYGITAEFYKRHKAVSVSIYTAIYRAIDGAEYVVSMTAKSLASAKHAAFQRSSGTTSAITISGPDGSATRTAWNTARGFSGGVQCWKDSQAPAAHS